ncbi:hypothetical protein HK100_001716 [Physocladia obscura]|uniref:Major facilitator superfamily (MFS) profile domain-containing protein n=1 Tax=Physocladia obscura TaxID=109957 RepID=A0AAD5T9Y0_9FUNG|nr:hypothetical protein HK100_001716 [Physocladia obscura]
MIVSQDSEASNGQITDDGSNIIIMDSIVEEKTTKVDASSSNPRDWPRRKKWIAVTLAALYTFVAPICSTMVAPAFPYITADLGFTSTIQTEMILSIFVLSYVIGPLFLGPLSEVYGRYIVLQVSLWFFVIMNTACGLSRTATQMLVFRFFAGIGGSAPLVLTGSVVSDCFSVAEMGAAMSYSVLGIVVGPAIGPILGGFLTAGAGWRWLFHTLSIFSGFLAIVGTFMLPETYRPLLESRKETVSGISSRIVHSNIRIVQNLITAITRPFIMIFTQPIVQIIALIMGFVYGVLFIVLATFSALFVKKYEESTEISTLHYIALGLGFFGGNRIAGSLLDVTSKFLQSRNNTSHKPEYRLPVIIPAAILLPVALFLYGWSAENGWHWIVPDIGILLASMSINTTFQSLTVYTVDVYSRYSASALAAVGIFRYMAGFAFPLFATSMYDQYGYGWGNSILAFAGIVIGIPSPILLYIYGERIREKSQFATGE